MAFGAAGLVESREALRPVAVEEEDGIPGDVDNPCRGRTIVGDADGLEDERHVVAGGQQVDPDLPTRGPGSCCASSEIIQDGIGRVPFASGEGVGEAIPSPGRYTRVLWASIIQDGSNFHA